MEENQLQRQLADMRQSLLDQGFLDIQFTELEQLDYAEESFSEFVKTCNQYRHKLTKELEKNVLDFTKLTHFMNQITLTSTSLGAKRVQTESLKFNQFCKGKNATRKQFLTVKQEIENIKDKLGNYFETQLANMRTSLFDGGFLDEQFVKLEALQDSANSDFVEIFFSLFFDVCERYIINMRETLDKTPVEFRELDKLIHQLLGISSSFGAVKLKDKCTEFTACCNQENPEGCLRVYQELKDDSEAFKEKLQAFFQKAKQGGGVETANLAKRKHQDIL